MISIWSCQHWTHLDWHTWRLGDWDVFAVWLWAGLIFSTDIINPSICYLHFLLWKVQLMRIFYFVKLQILNSVRVRASTMLVKYCSIQYWFYVFSTTFCRVFVKITDTENNTQPIDIQGTHKDTITGKNTRDFHKFGFIFFDLCLKVRGYFLT